MAPLPPTSDELSRDDARPYFLWWTDVTVGRSREYLRSTDEIERAYFLGALLREANTRDVWLFVTPERIRRDWPRVLRHLGRTRAMWGYLQKDRGIDPGVLAWLLSQFPVEPLPMVLTPLDVAELRRYRDELAERFRGAAVPTS